MVKYIPEQPIKPKHVPNPGYEKYNGETTAEKKIVYYGVGKRPANIQNPFVSQIQIM